MKTIILLAVLLATAAPVFAIPATPTQLNLNLLNSDGSNIDINLLLTIDYTDGDGNPQSINSTGSSIITWSIYLGKSNMYSEVPAKDGTDITITVEEYRTDISVEGYAPLVITAVGGEAVGGDYYLSWISLRPTDAGGGIDGAQHLLPQLYTSAGGNFVMHWTDGADGGSAADAPDMTDSDSDGTPDFVEDFASYFETSYAFITGRGFNAPSSDAAEPNDADNRNPDGKYDIFIYNMSRYGYANAEQYPATPSYSYIGVDNDYAGFLPNQDPDGNAKGTMKITAAHTLFHAVQFTYDTAEEKWWMETTSTYMEDEVYPAVNDNYNYLSYWFEFSDAYGLKTIDGIHEYENFIFAKRLSEDFGDDVVRAIWAEMGTADGLTAIDNVLAASGSSIIGEFREFTIANFFLEDMYVDGADYRAAIAGDTTFGGVWIEAEYDEAVNGTPFTIDIGNINYDAWMDKWAADYVTLQMSGDTDGYAITFDGFDDAVNYDVSLVTMAGGVVNTTDFTLDANRDGTVDLLYDPAYTDVLLIIRNSGSVGTTNPMWKVKIRDLFIPPENTVIYTYTNDSDVPIPDNNGWVSSEITVPPADSGTIKDVLVYVGIDHTFRGDLNVDLTSPEGTTVRLYAAKGNDSSYNIYSWYDNETPLDGPGVLDDFNNEESSGTWKLSAQDTYDGDIGFINTWSIKLYVDGPPILNIASPQNITYSDTSMALDVSANEDISTWWYSLNSGADTVFVPNTTITAIEGLNSITVYANDTTGNLASSSVYFTVDTAQQNITTYSISLNSGWNLISIPLEQGNWSLTSVLAPIEGKYTVVFAYIGGGWKRSTAPRSALTDMSLEYGYWINMTESATLQLSGTTPSATTMNVDTGWNLVGYPSLTAQNLTIVLSPISYTVVFEYRDGGWKRSTAPRSPLTDMSPGYGYWINTTGAGSYEVNDAGPTTYNISLNSGWNLISIPLEQSNWSLTTVLAPIEGKYTVVFAYIGGGWKRSTAPRSALTDMSLEYGYWINMTESATLQLSGTTPSATTMNVDTGWNLVGYPSLTAQNLTIVLSPISYTVVFEYRDGGWKRSTAPRSPLTDMSPGYGYWVNATDTGTYEV